MGIHSKINIYTTNNKKKFLHPATINIDSKSKVKEKKEIKIIKFDKESKRYKNLRKHLSHSSLGHTLSDGEFEVTKIVNKKELDEYAHVKIEKLKLLKKNYNKVKKDFKVIHVSSEEKRNNGLPRLIVKAFDEFRNIKCSRANIEWSYYSDDHTFVIWDPDGFPALYFYLSSDEIDKFAKIIVKNSEPDVYDKKEKFWRTSIYKDVIYFSKKFTRKQKERFKELIDTANKLRSDWKAMTREKDEELAKCKKASQEMYEKSIYELKFSDYLKNLKKKHPAKFYFFQVELE